MVVYDLTCEKGHRFEGWFDDLKDFKAQKRKNLLTCPVCGNGQVDRIPSSFGIAKSSGTQPKVDEAAAGRAMAKAFMHYVQKNFEDVGPGFAKEALKIHYGAEKPRNIRGVSTAEEEKMLKNEGVEFYKLGQAAPPSPDSGDDEA